jgi:transposase
MLADALGRPLRFIVTAGQTGDITQAPALLEGQTGDAVLADKAYDSNALRALIASMNAEAVIPSNRSRKIIIPHDVAAYKHRNRIERCFNRLKHFRRFATRYDRRTIHFTGFIHLAAAMIWLCRMSIPSKADASIRD